MKPKNLVRKGKKLILWLLLLLVVTWSFFPILYIAVTSLKPETEMFSYPPFMPSYVSLENYTRLLGKYHRFWDSLKNSMIITLLATTLTVAVSIPAAYAVSRYKNRKIAIFTIFTIIIRMLPPIVISIPLFPLLNTLGLIDTHIVIILLYSAFMVSLITLITRSFIDGVPKEIEEAARIDGCSRAQVLIKIVFPLIGPSIAATTVITAGFTWNEYLFAFLFTATKARTTPIIISEMLQPVMAVDWGVLFAATFIQLIPILVFTLVVQKYFVEGLTLGAVKG